MSPMYSVSVIDVYNRFGEFVRDSATIIHSMSRSPNSNDASNISSSPPFFPSSRATGRMLRSRFALAEKFQTPRRRSKEQVFTAFVLFR